MTNTQGSKNKAVISDSVELEETRVVEQPTSKENDDSSTSITVTINDDPEAGRFTRLKNKLADKKKVFAYIAIGATVVSIAAAAYVKASSQPEQTTPEADLPAAPAESE